MNGDQSDRTNSIHRITLVGMGNVGRAWAICFAKGGCDVMVYDPNPAALSQSLAMLDESLADLVEVGIIDDASPVRDRIAVRDSLDGALDDTQYVQESALEDLDLKRELFAELDALTAPNVILASSTSEFMASQFAADLPGASRILVAHPFNPPYLIPTVELVGHPGTDPDVVSTTRSLMGAIGMSPVVLNKEIKSFLLNRLQAAVVTEALHLVGEGYCSPEDLDSALRDGLAMRWSFMGPFLTGHLNASGGYGEYMRTIGPGFRRAAADLCMDYDWDLDLVDRVSDAMEKTIPLGDVQRGQRWRNHRLALLRKHLQDAEDYSG